MPRRLRERGPVRLAALAAHFAYDTLVIGGEHFEHRVYAHLAPTARR
jgi:hypothetical protein